MRRVCLIAFSAVILFAAFAPATASAQATRTWVSGVGDDANPCSRTAPCKTFAGAISKTAAGGEISVLDPGGFGGVTITKALTINGEGTLAGLLVAGGATGVIINAGVNDRVILRNLAINGIGTGLSGIRFLAGRELLVQDTTISGFTSRGVDVAVPSGTTLTLKNVTISNVPTGVRVTSVSGSAVAMLDNVSLNALTTGLEAAVNGFVIIRNSSISRNSTGLLASASPANIIADQCVLSFNGTGVNASVAGANIRLSNNHIFVNTAAIAFAGGGVVSTGGGNRVDGNGGGTTFNGAAVPVL